MNNPQKTQQTGFIIAGISVRTTNKNGQAQKDIGDLWNRFFKEHISATIPDKESGDIYCLYTDYESDHQGMYTTILGHKVADIEKIKGDLTVKYISEAVYEKYISTGELPNCVANTWMHIWSISDVNRKYVADFDVYGKDAQDPKNATVYTYLSIKN